jgi:hypothetical protein
MLTTTQSGFYCYYPYFAHMETCINSLILSVGEPKLTPGRTVLETVDLTIAL